MPLRILYLLVVPFLFIVPLNAQNRINISTPQTADLDMDGVADTLRYDPARERLVFRLSWKDFQPEEYEYYLSDDPYAHNWFEVVEGGFTVHYSYVRASEWYNYEYDAEAGKFRLTYYYHKNLGPATNDGSGTMTLDFETGIFTGDWYYYDERLEELIPLPTAKIYVDNPPIYLDDPEDYEFPGYECFEIYKASYIECYQPPTTDTVRYHSYYFEGGEFPLLVGTTMDGEPFSHMSADMTDLYRDDVIAATFSVHCYNEPEDNSYRAGYMITDIALVEPGRVRLFMESKQKIIDYDDDSQYVETWDTRRLEGIDFFLAVTENRRIRRAMTQPGKIEVFFSDYKTDAPQIANNSVCFLTGIYNTVGDSKTLIYTLLMEMVGDYAMNYYGIDTNSGKLTPLNIK